MARAQSEDTALGVATATGQEITLADGSKVVVRRADPEEVLAFLTGSAVATTDEDTETIMRQMVSQVFTGETAEEILGVGAVTHVKDYLDRPVTILEVDWRKSAFVNEEGLNAQGKKVLPVFVVIHAVDADRKPITLTTGAFLPCAQLFHMARQNVLSDLRVKFVQRERETSNGFRPINLVVAD